MDPFISTVTVNTRLTPEDWFQETRHLELDLCGFPSQPETPYYKAGDVAYIYPLNPDDAVATAMSFTKLSPDVIVEFEAVSMRPVVSFVV